MFHNKAIIQFFLPTLRIKDNSPQYIDYTILFANFVGLRKILNNLSIIQFFQPTKGIKENSSQHIDYTSLSANLGD